MRRISWTAAWVVLVAGLGLPVTSLAQTPEEYQKRRQAARDAMEPDSVMVVRNTPITDDSGLPRLDPNFLYLTGVADPGAALVLYASKRSTPEGGWTALLN